MVPRPLDVDESKPVLVNPYGHCSNLDLITLRPTPTVMSSKSKCEINELFIHWYCMFYFQKNALLREGTHRVHQREGPSRALSSMRARFAIA